MTGDLLYAGPDLHSAAAKSHVAPAGWHLPVRNAAAIVAEALLRRCRRRETPGYELVLATGVASDAGEKLKAAYAGTGVNRDWCISTVLPAYEETERTTVARTADLHRKLADLAGEVDVLFIEGVPGEVGAGSGLTFVSMPAWIKQRVRIAADWAAQVDGMRRITRQEVRRIFRKYGYTCDLTREPAAFETFFEEFYLPYTSRKFGRAAHVVDRSLFMKECNRGVLLRVGHAGDVLGSALLRPVGRTMAVVWSALDPARESAGLRGVTDTMDYFSLLYAHLGGYRWLDLGPSRPNLDDGVLRYKSRWGAEIYRGLTPQPRISWACTGRSEAALGFLRNNTFLVHAPSSRLRALLFLDGDADAEALAARLSSREPGVDEYRLVFLSPPGNELEEIVNQFSNGSSSAGAIPGRDVMEAACAPA